jgi:uncharacterized protein
MTRKRLLKISGISALAVFALTAAALAAWFAFNPPAPILLAWENLLPPDESGAAPAPPRVWGMVFDDTVPAGGLPTPVGRDWQPQLTRVVDALDGKLVSIAGYVVPLGFDATKVKEFLLVPYFGACIHVPPPPPNQIVLVRLTLPAELELSMEPVVVTGVMRVAKSSTSLADAGYQITANGVTPYE